MQFILIALIALLLSCPAISTADEQLLNVSAILELNVSTVNSTPDRYALFVLDFYKTGCDPCQRMNVSLSELSNELNGQIAFGKINSQKNRGTAEFYNITSYPTLLLFDNGTVISKSVGYGSKSGIVASLRKLKPDLNTSLVTPEKPSSSKAPALIKKNCTDMKKQDKPTLEAFIVSYCPFGLQMQRLLLGVIKEIPDLSANINIRYIIEMDGGNVTSMHGQEESDENLRQICIREEQPDKYWDYISSFLESGNASQCTRNASVSEAKLNGCLAEENRSLKYAMADFNETAQYGITGSPTLLLNGERISESDFGGRTEQALKNLICCGFASPPDFCSMNLSSEKAKTGFTSKKKEQSPAGPASATKSKAIPLAKVGAINPSMPVLVTDKTMAQAVQKYPVFVLMGFADWCGYCQMMNVTVQELARDLQGQVTFGLMNAEQNNLTAEEYNLVSYPRLLVFNNGTLVSTQTGYKSSSEFAMILNGLNLLKSRQKTPPFQGRG
jgi:thioredoxin 1